MIYRYYNKLYSFFIYKNKNCYNINEVHFHISNINKNLF